MSATSANSLISVAVSKRNGLLFSKTLLLTTARVLDTSLQSGVAEFWYDQAPRDLKEPATQYTCSTYTERNLLWAINRADPNQPRFKVHVMRSKKVGAHSELKIDKMFTISIDQILYGYDKDTISSYLWIVRGSETYRLELSHVISDLIRAASKSASLSRSPMS